ncbi:MAG: hypothetical protein ACHQFW_07545, partial [Chitinophagales bacterium]
DDDALFDKITALTYPEIAQFFKLYVEGTKPLPYDKYFAMAGIQKGPTEYNTIITLGNISLDYDFREAEKKIIVSSLEGSNDFAHQIGYMVGDRLVSINKKFSLTDENANTAIDRWKAETSAGDKVTIVIERKMENGKTKQIKLKAHAMEIQVEKPAILLVDENATPEQIKLRKDWLDH